MRISVTERQLFKRCRRKWHYASYNRQSLSPVVNSAALDLGTLIHATLAAWTLQPTDDPTLIYSDLALAQLKQTILNYNQRVGCDPSEAELKPTKDAIGLGLVMISNYRDHWKQPLPYGFTLVENELSLVQPIPGTEHCTQPRDCYCGECHQDICSTSSPHCQFKAVHELECTFDGVMADEHGDLYIIERKTYKRTPTPEELNQNDQFLAYQWALTQQFPNVVGLAYDGLLKRTSPVSGKNYDSLFLRRTLLRPQAELIEFQQQLAQEAMQMADPNLAIYKTVPFMGCARWECAFLDLCNATSRGEHNLVEHYSKMFIRSDRKKYLDIPEAE